ncbi:MAG: PilN domain-containing protein [Actinobacteria bacterium]|nr:PilN domain-containing protein [Actinomycetota bacterium]
MRRVNLLPPDERRRAAERLRGGAVGVLLVVGAVALIAMVGVYLFFLMRINAVEDDIAELDRQITEQNQRLAELAPYRDLQARLDAKKPVADGIFRTRFPWDEFLQGLAFIIPETTALDTFTAEAAPINIQAPIEQPLEPPGSITFTGIALPRYQNVADFVVQMNNLRFLANAELNSAELDRQTFGEPAINFEVVSELVTVVGESGTEVRIEEGTPAEVADTAAEDQYQARAGRPGIERQ